MDTTAGPNAVEVGSWEPMQGLVLKDDLFPHITGGLRGRVLTVASMDVSNNKTGNAVQSNAAGKGCIIFLSNAEEC